jgi:hypothetical protein
MRMRKPETAESVRRNDLRSVARVERGGIVADESATGGGSYGRVKSCLRILAPIRVLGRVREAFPNVGAARLECARDNEKKTLDT